MVRQPFEESEDFQTRQGSREPRCASAMPRVARQLLFFFILVLLSVFSPLKAERKSAQSEKHFSLFFLQRDNSLLSSELLP